MNIAMVVAKYDETGSSPYLTNELADALTVRGHHVTVLYVDWEAEAEPKVKYREGQTLHVDRTMPRGKGLVAMARKWSLAPLKYLSFGQALSKRYDLAIYYSPLFVAYPLIALNRLKARRKLAVYWDFFPYHQVELGMIPRGPIEKGLHAAELHLLRQMDVIGLMSPKNRESFRRVFGWKDDSRLRLLPIWGGSERLPLREPDAQKYCVFGGQLAPGRNIEALVRAAEFLPADIELRIYGRGPLQPALEALIRERGLKNVRLMGQVSREQYQREIAGAWLGLIITDPNAKTDSFPSKVIDYFRVALPVLAITEEGSDFGSFVQETAQGGRKLHSDDPQQIAAAIAEMVATPQRSEWGRSGHAYYYAHMTADRIAEQVEEMAQAGLESAQ
ncbi:glycosyl transferase group 1 (plasmid) [Deinococcus proteolyticus MRP]|uniref:Glycosyl transferase group 1 n=1 Tax=Deinococcus proteolyticus (strain ATCC 35074 / DSM 20540 / JCM 6276 / NBRC 101906 / NCIMB 13154 / VKM Ac-1939 / CCM 2703 / MRP) TaxID=693977 RepID=F0RPY5_DEIPM|nr:glycosyltransferase family 4 protein [Deinococcus proteolyticus]ADY27187.1 glycosyl transferase group 1 [Deinococcus proteolyticus MRP]